MEKKIVGEDGKHTRHNNTYMIILQINIIQTKGSVIYLKNEKIEENTGDVDDADGVETKSYRKSDTEDDKESDDDINKTRRGKHVDNLAKFNFNYETEIDSPE